uniref:Nudix hydrolase domain-containing protein n=1 Tax=Nannospalax galili TaxID=1026970 RepID=A0A8C6R8U2_NANGA
MFQASKTHLDDLHIKQLEEVCIVIDKQDQIIGVETKKNCHLMENIEKGDLFHQGFSVILFNTKNQLLVQQRLLCAQLFQGHFMDSCSSHPLYTPNELEEKDVMGMRRAALRYLQTELGIHQEQDIIFMSQKYQSVSVRCYLTLDPDAREVKSFRYMSQEEVWELLDRRGFLFPWWPYLENVSPFVEPDKIHGL